MVPAIADVDCNSAVHCLKYRMPCVALQVVCGFIKVSDPGYMVLQTVTAIKLAWLQLELPLHSTSKPYMLTPVCQMLVNVCHGASVHSRSDITRGCNINACSCDSLS